MLRGGRPVVRSSLGCSDFSRHVDAGRSGCSGEGLAPFLPSQAAHLSYAQRRPAP